ncbi:Acetoacetyl-CoA synthetase [Labilithrix luteola]|uniref:Acetoacetyl-CoA synthetase n=1 Tax=Labilithrix luteola TaxID=1391654 RepID=A0A0K1PJ61_9BACT|nr:fatty acyl-CoA synthetase [Labilithrix luteola]AKU93557.1 Acetoacetyl-CoA synthetase [Labilithrix luteola]
MNLTNRSTVGDLVTRSARRVPGAHALRFEDRSWTYRELDRASTRVAHALLGLGLKKGDRVAAFGKNSDAYILLWLGVVKAGLIHVPVNFALSGRELAYILEQSGARAVFADRALQPAIASSGVSPEFVGTLRDGAGERDVLAWAKAEGPVAPLEVDIADHDVAQLLYTSGTTSEPKGAILTHRALVHHYASSAMALDARASERQLHALPLYHSAQMHVFMMPSLMLGAPNWLLETPDPTRVLEAMAANEIDAFFAAPTVWIALLALIEIEPSRACKLRKAYYGASIMPTPVLQKLRALLPGLGFYNCFGQSEIGPLATVLRPEEHEARPASAGRAIPFVDMRVVDDDMNDVAPGEVGEVVYRSPQLCLGYWEKPEETRAAFEGGWFHSGDLARIDAEGYITIVDRKKDVIKTGGVVVSSREIEEALFTHPSVREVAVIPVPDAKWIEAVTAVVVLRDGAVADEAVLIEHARSNLAPFKVPKRVHFVEALPKNTAGKLLKRELKVRFSS